VLYSHPFLANQEKDEGEKKRTKRRQLVFKTLSDTSYGKLLNFFYVPNADINVHSFHYVQVTACFEKIINN